MQAFMAGHPVKATPKPFVLPLLNWCSLSRTPFDRNTSRIRYAGQGLLDIFGRRGEVELAADPAIDALAAWLHARGLPSPQRVAAADLGGSGRGLVAARRIARGESLLQVPAHLLLTPDSAAEGSALAAAAAAAGLPVWSQMACWLAEAQAAGAGHAWAPYVAVLPKQPGSVLEWSEEEVGWLQGSPLHQTAADIRAAARTSSDELAPVVAAAEAAGVAPPGAASPAALLWAFGVLLSRLVRLSGGSGGGGELEALVPWADLANHDCAATTFLAWGPGASAVVLEADRGYRQGEEVVVSYGQKTSGQLLLSYGFLPAPSTNPHDAVLLAPARLASAAAAGGLATPWKAAALGAAGLGGQDFPLRMGATPGALLSLAAFAAAPAESSEEAERLARQLLLGGGGDALAARPDLRPAALMQVVAWCQEALEGYPSDLSSDQRELRALQEQSSAPGGSGGGGSPASSRRQSVLEVLVFERQVLHRNVFLLQQELREARRGGGRR